MVVTLLSQVERAVAQLLERQVEGIRSARSDLLPSSVTPATPSPASSSGGSGRRQTRSR